MEDSDSGVGVTFADNTSFAIVNPFEAEKEKLANDKNKKDIMILVVGIGLIVAYMIYKKK